MLLHVASNMHSMCTLLMSEHNALMMSTWHTQEVNDVQAHHNDLLGVMGTSWAVILSKGCSESQVKVWDTPSPHSCASTWMACLITTPHLATHVGAKRCWLQCCSHKWLHICSHHTLAPNMCKQGELGKVYQALCLLLAPHYMLTGGFNIVINNCSHLTN